MSIYSICELWSSLIPTGEAVNNQMHKATSACCYFVCTFYSSINILYEFIGENCVLKLLNTLKVLAGSCISEMKKCADIEVSKNSQMALNVLNNVICNRDFTKSNYKVRDPFHRTGKHRGAAHTRCNTNYYNKWYLPIVVHTLKGYDSHLSLKEAFEICGTHKSITPIPNSMEQLMMEILNVLIRSSVLLHR